MIWDKFIHTHMRIQRLMNLIMTSGVGNNVLEKLCKLLYNSLQQRYFWWYFEMNFRFLNDLIHAIFVLWRGMRHGKFPFYFPRKFLRPFVHLYFKRWSVIAGFYYSVGKCERTFIFFLFKRKNVICYFRKSVQWFQR